jgi:hypothetical protein
VGANTSETSRTPQVYGRGLTSMGDDPLQLDEWRVPGGINLGDEILKESPSSKNSSSRQLPREPRHGLELLGNDDDFHLVKVNRSFRVIEYPAEFFFNTVFDSLNAE